MSKLQICACLLMVLPLLGDKSLAFEGDDAFVSSPSATYDRYDAAYEAFVSFTLVKEEPIVLMGRFSHLVKDCDPSTLEQKIGSLKGAGHQNTVETLRMLQAGIALKQNEPLKAKDCVNKAIIGAKNALPFEKLQFARCTLLLLNLDVVQSDEQADFRDWLKARLREFVEGISTTPDELIIEKLSIEKEIDASRKFPTSLEISLDRIKAKNEQWNLLKNTKRKIIRQQLADGNLTNAKQVIEELISGCRRIYAIQAPTGKPELDADQLHSIDMVPEYCYLYLIAKQELNEDREGEILEHIYLILEDYTPVRTKYGTEEEKESEQEAVTFLDEAISKTAHVRFSELLNRNKCGVLLHSASANSITTAITTLCEYLREHRKEQQAKRLEDMLKSFLATVSCVKDSTASK